MSGPAMGADTVTLVGQVRNKFEKLEKTCMERYQSREQRVLSTLSFCMTAIEQLQSWALFAIFPTDEQNSDKYVGFVEQRFQCVIQPLRIFQTALQRISPGCVGGASEHNSDSGSLQGSRGSSPRDYLSPHSSPRSSEQRSPRERLARGGSLSHDHRSGSSCDSGLGSETNRSHRGGSTLRDRTNHMCSQYLDEGQHIKQLVLYRLQKCRKDLRTIYRWGQASLLDLQEILDDALADELYFLVRGKMQRVLSTISAFEEAAERIEKNLAQLQNGNGISESGDEGDNISENGTEGLDLRLNLDTSNGESVGYGDLGPSERERHMYLEDVDRGQGHRPRVGSYSAREAGYARGEGEEGRHYMDSNSDGTPGSTPEPPHSPRPKGLVNHPKIMQDKLRSFALPSKFTGLRLSTTW